ncbi:MAG: helix-turn-helix domain-containing protein, partial [Candidatus Spechtbacterales bacterium]
HLEREEYEKLPPPVYIRGFLQRWARVTGGDAEALAQQFGRENRFLVTTSQARDVSVSARVPRFVFTLKHISVALAGVTALVLVGYFYYNQILASNSPSVEITSPVDVSSVSSRRVVEVTGNTESVNRLTLNGQEVVVGSDGAFAHAYILSDGPNTLSLIAEGDNESIEAIRTIIYVEAGNP